MQPVAATTTSRQFVWTVIPAGRVTTVQGRPFGMLSVLLTPRLSDSATTQSTLKNFGLAEWPTLLADTTFQFTCGGRDVEAQRIASGFTPAQQRAAWSALFGPNLAVTPYRAVSYADRPVSKFPASAAAGEVHDAYRGTGLAFAHYSTPGNEEQLQHALTEATDAWQRRLTHDGAAPETFTSALDEAFAFYRREHTLTSLDAKAANPQREFHRTVVQLADHPTLLRALGLLLDFGIDATTLDRANPHTLSVRPKWPSNPPAGWTTNGFPDSPDLSPTTAYTLTGARFVPDSADSPIINGVLALHSAGLSDDTGSRFQPLTFDVDGAALRMVTAGRDDRHRAAAATGDLPALRSLGVALIDRDRVNTFLARAARNRIATEELFAQPLRAGDLVGGYRLDIQDTTTGAWLSTCQRRVSYTIGEQPFGPELCEEGFVRPDALITGAGPHDRLYVHEVVSRWDGFSQAVQRPGRPVTTGDTMPPDPTDLPLKMTSNVEPGSLPRLRFGRKYLMRIRIADLAGGGLKPVDLAATDNEQTLTFTHQRFEPLSPPEVLPAATLAPGEALDKMMVDATRTTTHRHILCPATSLEVALQHSVFDKALGPNVSEAEVDKYFTLATRADKTAIDIPNARLEGLAGAKYVVVPAETTAAPWLPDPGARRVIFAVKRRPRDPDDGHPMPPIDGTLPTRPSWAPWPDRPAIRLELAAVETGCKVTTSPDGQAVKIELGRAEQLTLNLLSTMGPEETDVLQFGIAEWITNGTAAEAVASFADTGNPLVTPGRELTVVHAVQKPLAPPIGRLDTHRCTGRTDTVLGTTGLNVHIPSTGRLEITASWNDKNQIPPEIPNGPGSSSRTEPVGAFNVKHTCRSQALPQIRHELADTRRRLVTYTVDAVSRFEDCYPGAALGACSLRARFTVDVPSSARPPAPDVLYCVPAFSWSTEVGADGKVQRLRGGKRIRVFLRPPWFVSGRDEMLAVLTNPTAIADTAVGVSPYLSVAGRDPVWQGPNIATVLTAQHFSAPVSFTPADAHSPARPGVAFRIEIDKAARRWYADVDMSPFQSAAYCPFVRLALARYQSNTTDPRALALSEVTRTEPVPLLPDRRLEIIPVPTRDRFTVRLSGVGPTAPREQNTVTAEIQAYDDGSGHTPSGPPASEVIGSPGWVSRQTVTGKKLGESFTIGLPVTAAPRRLVITEAENHPPAPDPGSPAEGPPRLVFADILTIRADGRLDLPSSTAT